MKNSVEHCVLCGEQKTTIMEIDYKKLEEKGINIADRDYTKEDPQKMFCPKCKKDRKKHMNNKPLAVYWKDCYAKCFNCGDSFFFGKTRKLNDGQPPDMQPMKQKSKDYKKPGKLANEEPLDNNMRRWFEDRGIPVEVAEAEGVFKASRKMLQTGKVKFRHLGQPGVASFQYNTCCGRFTPMQESKTPDIPDEDPKWDNDNWLAKKQPTQKGLDI